MYHFLGPDKNFLYLVNPFFFQSFPTFRIIGELKILNSYLDASGPMAFCYFLGNSVQSRLKKGIPSFDKSSFNFSFLFYKQLNTKRCTAFWLNSFFRKIVVNVHNRVRENGGRIVNNVDRMRVIRRQKIENLILQNSQLFRE